MSIFKSTKTPDKPTSIKVTPAPVPVYAPVSGALVDISDSPDPIFSKGAMGQGVSIKPESDVIYAPVTGTVTSVIGTNHAIGLTSDDGVEVLVHIGVDTVEMQGEGFTSYVGKDQHVEAGEALLSFDRDKIEAANKPDDVMMVVTNTNHLPHLNFVSPTHVKAGDVVAVVSH